MIKSSILGEPIGNFFIMIKTAKVVRFENNAQVHNFQLISHEDLYF